MIHPWTEIESGWVDFRRPIDCLFLSPFDSALVRAQTYTDDIGGSDDKGSPDFLIQCVGKSLNLPQPISYIVKLASLYRCFTGSSKYSLNSGLFVGVWFHMYGCLHLYFIIFHVDNVVHVSLL